MVFEVSIQEWVGIPWEQERKLWWKSRSPKNTGHFRMVFRALVRETRLKKGNWGQDPGRLYAPAFLGWKWETTGDFWAEVWLEVCQWKMNLATLLCVHSCWERSVIGRPTRKLMQWSRGQKVKLWTSTVGREKKLSAAGNWGARGGSSPRSQVSPWDGLPHEGPWSSARKNSTVSHNKVKASLFRKICTPQTEWGPSQQEKMVPRRGVIWLYGLGCFIG